MPYRSTDKYCSPQCSRESEIEKETAKAMKIVERNRRIKRLEQKEADQQALLEIMTRPQLAKEVQENKHWGINLLVRQIDKGHSCISGSTSQKQFHAGHYLSVGAHEELRYHLMNIWLQSAQDNTYRHANIHGYRKGIIELGGQELMDELDNLPLKNKNVRIMKVDLMEMIPTLKQLIKEAKKLPPKLPAKARIAIRREYNKRIGIYVD